MKQEVIQILICDDDELNLGVNKRCVEIISQREHKKVQVYAFQEFTEELIRVIEENQIEIAILDIVLGNKNGLDIARMLLKENKKIPIIFVTGYGEYKSEAWDLMALGYLEKPIDLGKFELLYSRALAMIECERRKKFLELIDIVANKRHIQLRLSSIISVEKVLRKVEFHTLKGKYTTNGTLNEISKSLGNGFIKVNQSVIVNRSKILSVDSTTVYMTNGEQHVIGRTYVRQVRNMLKNQKIVD